MPSKSLHKVQKHVIQKKGKNAPLHANSRDSQRLRRASAREDKQIKAASERERLRQPYVKRVEFFREAAQQMTAPLAEEEMHKSIQSYLDRHTTELVQLKAERRPGRPTSTRHDALVQLQSHESSEYHSGFWLPDLRNWDSITTLKAWNGDWNAMNTLTFCRASKDGVTQASCFPPKGLS